MGASLPLEMMRCPTCEGGLGSFRDRLECEGGHHFPVAGGVARFCPPSTYADSFGYEWTRFPKVQLDSQEGSASEETFREKTGLKPADVKGKTVLDAGCGMGRFSDVVARWGASTVVAADLSRAVEPASDNLMKHDSVTVVQADLFGLPVAKQSFDIVFSIGVLHHTPSTFDALRRIAEYVKPGGRLCVWVYSRRLQLTLAGGEVIRLFTRRMKEDQLLRTISTMAPKVHSIKEQWPRLAPFVNAIVPVSNHADEEWRILDTFDWYSPQYQWKHSEEEVKGWFRRLGFTEVTSQAIPVSVSGLRQYVGDGSARVSSPTYGQGN